MKIVTLTKGNLSLLKDSFLLKETVEQEWHNNPFGIYLIVVDQNEVVGYLYYSRIYERVEINQFEVRKDKRKRGIGTKLLETLIKKEPTTITLEVRENNQEAISLYQKFNFEKKAIRKGYYQGIDGLLMERDPLQKKQ
ncbi:MAG TPA: GNAT family N-acetyltransferase [Candidatus Onthousia faecigallinarum]|nr:GNAT family N-acetyltransferase [Candidatus Onthousia faecigallinarum]